jgi:hypothetical protein
MFTIAQTKKPEQVQGPFAQRADFPVPMKGKAARETD